jgi:hypothetical protein
VVSTAISVLGESDGGEAHAPTPKRIPIKRNFLNFRTYSTTDRLTYRELRQF